MMRIVDWSSLDGTQQQQLLQRPAVVANKSVGEQAASIIAEVRADGEKSAFKKDASNHGKFISTGIWAWSRHPNYFGEITLWVGMALIALPAFDGREFFALVSPLFVILLLTKISGLPALERRGLKRWGDDPAYQEYLKNVPVLIPRPPR